MPIDFRNSNLPSLDDQTTNCKYWLESFGTNQVIRFQEIDKALYLDQANSLLRSSNAAPYFGRCCHLCEHTDVAFASVSQKNRVMWCLSCGRTFFKGHDITDYTQWNPPKEISDIVAQHLYGDDAEAVMYAAGMTHLASKVKQLTSNDIDVSEVDKHIKDLGDYFAENSEIYYDPKTKMLCWDNPEIKRLTKSEMTSAGKAVALIVLFLMCLTVWLLAT